MSKYDKTQQKQRNLQIQISKKKRVEYLPDSIKQRVQAIETDPRQILDLTDDIVLNEALLRQTAERIDTGESDRAWDMLEKVFDRLTSALNDGNQVQAEQQLRALSTIIKRGKESADTRRELNDYIGKSVQYKRDLMRQAVDHGQIVSTAVLVNVLEKTAQAIVDVCKPYQFGEEIGTKIVARLAQIHHETLPDAKAEP